MLFYILVCIISSIIWGIATNKVIENKGYNENWFWWGFFLWFIGLIVALTKPEYRPYEGNNYNTEHLTHTVIDPRTIGETDRKMILMDGGWECSYCHHLNQSYVTSCACGKDKAASEMHKIELQKQLQEYREQRKKAKESEQQKANPQEVSQQSESSKKELDKIEVLKKYKELLDMGAISQEEYETKKQALLK